MRARPPAAAPAAMRPPRWDIRGSTPVEAIACLICFSIAYVGLMCGVVRTVRLNLN